MRDRLFTFFKLLISFGLIIYLFTRPQMRLAETGQVLASANLAYLLVALALYFLAIAVNVYKWRLLLEAQDMPVPLSSLLSYFFTGLFFANFLMPQVAGDVVRGYGLARHSSGQAAEVAISVLVDRLVGLASFIVAAVLMSLYAVSALGRTDLTWVASVACLVLLVFALGFASLLSRRLRAGVQKLFGLPLLSFLAPLYERLSEAIHAYRRNYRVLLVAFGVAVGGLLLTNLVNYLVSEAVGANIPLVYIFVFNPLTPFAPLLIPSVGGLGVNQGVFVVLYNTIGRVTTSTAALSVSLLMQLIIYVSSLPGGILWWRGRR